MKGGLAPTRIHEVTEKKGVGAVWGKCANGFAGWYPLKGNKKRQKCLPKVCWEVGFSARG